LRLLLSGITDFAPRVYVSFNCLCLEDFRAALPCLAAITLFQSAHFLSNELRHGKHGSREQHLSHCTAIEETDDKEEIEVFQPNYKLDLEMLYLHSGHLFTRHDGGLGAVARG
jgi:hypothetical protein